METEDERLPEPVVERLEKPDGRYILYFSWPDDRPAGHSTAEADSADE